MYLIQISFITNSVAMLDLAHLIYLKILRCRSYAQRVLDDWYFDFAYHYAFVISVFILVLIFSVSAPLLTIFGFGFFSIKVLIHTN